MPIDSIIFYGMYGGCDEEERNGARRDNDHVDVCYNKHVALT